MANDKIVLSVNSGSSSLKISAYTCGAPMQLIAQGRVSNMPLSQVIECCFDAELPTILPIQQGEFVVASALGQFCHWLTNELSERRQPCAITLVAHRVVHGGSISQHSIIDAQLLRQIELNIPLDPLHLPANIASVHAAMALFPNALHVACFDTVFHRDIPLVAKQYALPKALFDQGVKRYGFHGLSYEYVCQRLQNYDLDFSQKKYIIAHLGSGASLCAIKYGVSQYCTMGFSALDGLTMSTRCGSLDPGVLLHLLHLNYSVNDLEQLLYRDSGLLGLSGVSGDLRVLLADHSALSCQAVEHFIFTVVRELGALVAILGGCDSLVFTGGIGENSVLVRDAVCKKLAYLGVLLDSQNNNDACHDSVISSSQSKVDVWVVPTNEELVMAEVAKLLAGGH